MSELPLRAGTLKDWVKSRKYWGTLRVHGVITWKCEHSHKTAREASECAYDELHRVKYPPQGPVDGNQIDATDAARR